MKENIIIGGLSRDIYESADEFIEKYILEYELDDYSFVCSVPYEFEDFIGLDVSDNNMMQYFVLIENTTKEEVLDKIVCYFK